MPLKISGVTSTTDAIRARRPRGAIPQGYATPTPGGPIVVWHVPTTAPGDPRGGNPILQFRENAHEQCSAWLFWRGDGGGASSIAPLRGHCARRWKRAMATLGASG